MKLADTYPIRLVCRLLGVPRSSLYYSARVPFDEAMLKTALLDLASAAEQVEVARSTVDLANQTLTQSRARFAAGVTDNLEVVQAQESLASANESYISSLYAHNLAKVELARAIGFAEQGVRLYLQGK